MHMVASCPGEGGQGRIGWPTPIAYYCKAYKIPLCAASFRCGESSCGAIGRQLCEPGAALPHDEIVYFLPFEHLAVDTEHVEAGVVHARPGDIRGGQCRPQWALCVTVQIEHFHHFTPLLTALWTKGFCPFIRFFLFPISATVCLNELGFHGPLLKYIFSLPDSTQFVGSSLVIRCATSTKIKETRGLA